MSKAPNRLPFSEKESQLDKRGKVNKGWKRRSFSLVNNSLVYSEPKDGKKLGFIPLEQAEIRVSKHKEIVSKQKPNVFEVITLERIYYLNADSESDMSRWISVLKECSGIGKTKIDQVLQATEEGIASVSHQKYTEEIALRDAIFLEALRKPVFGHSDSPSSHIDYLSLESPALRDDCLGLQGKLKPRATMVV